MTVYSGKLLKYDGSAGSYVNIFDWLSGKEIASLEPDIDGVWAYEPKYNLTAGIQYIGSGCIPVIHGGYELEGKYGAGLVSGFLMLSVASSGGRKNPHLDRFNTSTATWDEYFSHIIDISFLEYIEKSGTSSTVPYYTKTINHFSIDWRLTLEGRNASWNGDRHKWTFEVMDVNDNVILALKSETDGTFRSGLWVGTNLNSLKKCSTGGSYPRVTGLLTFTDSSINYVSYDKVHYIRDFTYNVDLTKASKIRVGGEATSTYTSGSTSGGWIRILPPVV